MIELLAAHRSQPPYRSLAPSHIDNGAVCEQLLLFVHNLNHNTIMRWNKDCCRFFHKEKFLNQSGVDWLVS